jgi:hypothetical protein
MIRCPAGSVSQLSSERDVAIAESRRLTEQNDQLRHLLKQLQRAQFGQRSERLDRDPTQLLLEDIDTALAERDAKEEEHQNSAVGELAHQRERRIKRCGSARGGKENEPTRHATCANAQRTICRWLRQRRSISPDDSKIP